MEQLWTNNLPDDVPSVIDAEQYSSLIDLFESSVSKYADQPAFVNMGAMLTYRKLEERSRAFAAYLQNELKLEGRSCCDYDAKLVAISHCSVWYFTCRHGSR